uniref:Uncharacterized protein n=1 Tax=Knipowitschia caucasica TaxID=637954 RepID=A0AAV2J3Z9_KNICA
MESVSFQLNKHKPWIETSYHGVITENTEVVLLDPPLVALDKDAPVPYAAPTVVVVSLGKTLYPTLPLSSSPSLPPPLLLPSLHPLFLLLSSCPPCTLSSPSSPPHPLFLLCSSTSLSVGHYLPSLRPCHCSITFDSREKRVV